MSAPDDGVALTSARHPPSEELIEAVCRAICREALMDPDGRYAIAGREGPLWALKRRQAIAAIYAVWDAEPRVEIEPGNVALMHGDY